MQNSHEILFLSGNGGATLTALDFLHRKYGDELYENKVLLLHAGGQTKKEVGQDKSQKKEWMKQRLPLPAM